MATQISLHIIYHMDYFLHNSTDYRIRRFVLCFREFGTDDHQFVRNHIGVYDNGEIDGFKIF